MGCTVGGGVGTGVGDGVGGGVRLGLGGEVKTSTGALKKSSSPHPMVGPPGAFVRTLGSESSF